MERILAARHIEFTAETRYSGIELIPRKKELTKEQVDTASSLKAMGNGIVSIIDKMIERLARSNASAWILKGSVDTIIPLVENVNEAELRWKAQEVSKSGGTPLAVAIENEAIGLIALKDELKENIRAKLNEVRATY